MRRKLVLTISAGIIMGVLAGCAKGNDVPVAENVVETDGEAESSVQETGAEAEIEEEMQEWVEERTHESRLANVITEDE